MYIHYLLILVIYRKFSIFNWRMSKRDTCLKITTWFLSRDMRRKEKFQMLSYSKRKRKPSNLKWLNNKTNKEKDKTSLELSKRTKWRTKLDFNLKDLLKWKSRKREDESKLMLRETIKINVERKKTLEIWKWMKSLKWRNLKWNLLNDYKILKLYRKKLTSNLKKLSDNHQPC